jgi:membrane dipeptidase
VEKVSDEEYLSRLHVTFKENLERHSDNIAFAGNAQDMLKNESSGRMSAFLAIEDGRSVEGKLENIKRYYDMGVRLISLTWNYENCFGFPNSKDPEKMAKGLKPFGRKAIEYMNELGMLVDVSHLSDGGFYEVAEISKKPFVASHSNCRALSPHTRNLTDAMLRILADKGGVAGLNFAPIFLTPDAKGKDATLELMSAHIRHMIKVAGEELPALGSDFDGIEGDIEVPDSSKMHLLLDRLLKDGVKTSTVEKVAYSNAQRVIREALR